MTAQWYYFGCGRSGQPGHYLHIVGGHSARGHDRITRYLESRFDGTLAPHLHPVELYRATFSTLPGLGYAAMAWHDQSVDRRPGSNSVIFAPHPECGRDWLKEEALQRFPWVFSRLPTPLEWWEPREPLMKQPGRN